MGWGAAVGFCFYLAEKFVPDWVPVLFLAAKILASKVLTGKLSLRVPGVLRRKVGIGVLVGRVLRVLAVPGIHAPLAGIGSLFGE